MAFSEQIDQGRLPAHVAIIMDGNGRWAKQRGRERSFGHQAGADSVHAVAEEAARMGIKFLTLYTFSTENWSRPAEEVAALMNLLIERLEEEIFMKNNIRFCIIGEEEKLAAPVRQALGHCIRRTASNTGMCMTLALSYSSRWELTRTMRLLAQQVEDGTLKPADIDEQVIDRNLATSYMPDPDLLIRTGGEQRLSNYLLWQSAYSELYFCDTYWPDFREEELRKAVAEYQRRERRFGRTSEQLK